MNEETNLFRHVYLPRTNSDTAGNMYLTHITSVRSSKILNIRKYNKKDR